MVFVCQVLEFLDNREDLKDDQRSGQPTTRIVETDLRLNDEDITHIDRKKLQYNLQIKVCTKMIPANPIPEEERFQNHQMIHNRS